MKTIRLLAPVALLCAVLISLTGCGGSGDSSPGSTTAQPSNSNTANGQTNNAGTGPTTPVEATQVFAFKSAYANYVNNTAGIALKVTETRGATTSTGTQTLTVALKAPTFDEKPGFSRVINSRTVLQSSNSTRTINQIYVEYYYINYIPSGLITARAYSPVSDAVLPDTIKSGDRFTFYKRMDYADNTRQNLISITEAVLTAKQLDSSHLTLEVVETEKSKEGGETLASTTTLYVLDDKGVLTLSTIITVDETGTRRVASVM